MADRVYRTEALILRRTDFNEADRLLTLVTPGGKRRVVAKGVRKTTSRLAGHIELFTHSQLLLALGRNLDIVTQSQILERYETLRTELPRLSCGYYAAELYDKVTPEEGEENPLLFRLMVQTFAALDTSTNPTLVLRMFELRLLHAIGYRPNLHRCVASQELLTEEANRFSPALGGMLSPAHTSADRNALPISLNAFKLLRYLQTVGDEKQPYQTIERLNISEGVQREAESVLRAYLRTILERELKTAAFLDSVLRSP
ncbi:MAG: DNA repair protein RecO [Chloroflexaceae bacterium]|jgi:DNA repair protein RecO (recombination protein O)|nr:DNA repair protein RecO [Chloroflexaceae bacterium]